ncbi:unnamed protein product, partial [marine sediment metagenome]
MGRSYLLAKLLQNNHQVKIVGPMFGDRIWHPLENSHEVKFVSIRITPRNSNLIWNIHKIIKECYCDLLYVSKPLLPSFGPGLVAKFKYKIP